MVEEFIIAADYEKQYIYMYIHTRIVWPAVEVGLY